MHYINWDSRYDEWIDRDSDRLADFRQHTVGNKGQLFSAPYGAAATIGDVVGCLWNQADACVSFTLNGKSMGVAFEDVRGVLFPAVTLHGELAR